MRTHKVELLAFGEKSNQFREVEVEGIKGDGNPLLDEIFKYGQNDFQSQKGKRSVSMGDVIHTDQIHWLVLPVGFRELSETELTMYRAMVFGERLDYLWRTPKSTKGGVI